MLPRSAVEQRINRDSGEHQEQALELLRVVTPVARELLVGEATVELPGKEPKANPIQTSTDRGKLLHDLLAVATLLDHVDDAAQLSVDPLQAIQRIRNSVALELHRSPPIDAGSMTSSDALPPGV